MCDVRRRIEILVAAAAAVGAASLCHAVGPLRPIALTGTSGPLGPGLGAGVTFSSMVLVKTVHPEFGTNIPAGPSLSGTGAVVFGGVLAGPGTSIANGSGIWAARGSGLSLVVRRGNQIPGLDAGYTFGELFTAPQICDTGAVTFQAMIEGNDSSIPMNEGIFTERSGLPTALIREGVTIAPESNPQIAFGLPSSNTAGDPWGNNGWVINRHGDTALRCFVRDENPQYNSAFGVWTDFGGPLAKHYRGGDTWTDGVQTFNFMGCSNPRLNDSGAFITARLTDTHFSVHPWTNRAVDANGFGIPGTGSLKPIFIPDVTPAPGTSSMFYSVTTLRDFHISAAGRVGFSADLDGGGPGAAGGFWSDGRFGALQLIALSGNPAPGTPTGTVFNTNAFFVLGSAMADNNVVVLACRLLQGTGVGGGNDTGVWSTRSVATGQPGNLRLLVREGSPVPAGFGDDYDGLNFGEVSTFWVNSAGRVAFMTLHNDFTQAIWVEQANGSLVPIVKEFTTLDIYGDGSDVRLITDIDPISSVASTGSGLATPFNDHGDMALHITFAGGSEGIFTTAPSVNCQMPAGAVSPATRQVHMFDAVLLTANYSGDGPMRFQWRHNGVAIPDATGPSHNALIFQSTDAGSYDCVLTNFCGSTISTPAAITIGVTCTPDFNGDGDIGTDADIEAFFSCLGGSCCPTCGLADFNGDGDIGTDSDIEAFFRVLAGGSC